VDCLSEASFLERRTFREAQNSANLNHGHFMPSLFFPFRVRKNKAIPQAVWVFTDFGRAKKMNNKKITRTDRTSPGPPQKVAKNKKPMHYPAQEQKTYALSRSTASKRSS
jgi:hypothetical protein